MADGAAAVYRRVSLSRIFFKEKIFRPTDQFISDRTWNGQYMIWLLQRVSIACYAERCISYDRFRLPVCLSVCHSPVSCQNNAS